jgi:hypothetical protein
VGARGQHRHAVLFGQAVVSTEVTVLARMRLGAGQRPGRCLPDPDSEQMLSRIDRMENWKPRWQWRP